MTAVFSLLDTEDNGSDDAVGVRAAATRLLGNIGSRPVHLPAVVPRLYTGLLHTEHPGSGRAAVRSWGDLAGQPQPLPSTLLDLLPALLTDGSAVVPALKLVDRLDIPLERRAALLPLVIGGRRRRAPRFRSTILSQRSRAASVPFAPLPSAFPTTRPRRRPAWRSSWQTGSRRMACGTCCCPGGLPAWRTAACSRSGHCRCWPLPEFADSFNERDYRVQAALLGCPYGIGLQPLERFLAVTDLHLPDRPWPALEMIEVLQRAARWDDAAEVARHISAAIPQDRGAPGPP